VFVVFICFSVLCVLVLFVFRTRSVKCVCVCYCVCFWFIFSDLEVKVGEYIELEGQGAMLETDEGQAAYYAPGCDIDSGEEGLAVLPRHTKVLVTGNNRTKSVLVGLHGVVKKAVGLGGWHWLVLTNGAQVKLQRNALSVIEAATGQEDDDDIEEDNLFFHGHSLGSVFYSMLLSPNCVL
jgi:hypothetical protein